MLLMGGMACVPKADVFYNSKLKFNIQKRLGMCTELEVKGKNIYIRSYGAIWAESNVGTEPGWLQISGQGERAAITILYERECKTRRRPGPGTTVR